MESIWSAHVGIRKAASEGMMVTHNRMADGNCMKMQTVKATAMDETPISVVRKCMISWKTVPTEPTRRTTSWTFHPASSKMAIEARSVLRCLSGMALRRVVIIVETYSVM